MTTAILALARQAGMANAAGWRRVPVGPELRALLAPNSLVFQKECADGHLSAIVSRESETGWHLSISHRHSVVGPDGKHPPGRYPTWDEIRDARYLLLPDEITVGILLPPRAEYVNVHPTTFHLYQVEA